MDREVRYSMFYKLLCIMFVIIFCWSFLVEANAKEAPLIAVKIGILEAFSSIDSVASKRYRDAFEHALFYAVGENEKRLNSCGYKLEITPQYFDNSDLISAGEGAQTLENNMVWIILGPAKSDQFLAATKKLKHTPIISSMAKSDKAINLMPPNFTMSQSEKIFAFTALSVIEKERWGHHYGSFIDASCTECLDFSNSFDLNAQKKGGYQKAFSIDSAGDHPDLTKLIENLKQTPVDFLVLPNYSKFTGYTISKLHTLFPLLKFLGTDGWGQSTWSYLPGYKIANDVEAIAIRSGLPDKEFSKKEYINSLDLFWNERTISPPQITYNIVNFMRILTGDLCLQKPKTSAAFYSYLKTQPKNKYRSTTPISAYKLSKGQLEFAYKV